MWKALLPDLYEAICVHAVLRTVRTYSTLLTDLKEVYETYPPMAVPVSAPGTQATEHDPMHQQVTPFFNGYIQTLPPFLLSFSNVPVINKMNILCIITLLLSIGQVAQEGNLRPRPGHCRRREGRETSGAGSAPP